MRIAVTLVLSLLMLGTVAWGQAPVPVGDQFQVNTYTTDQQWFPSVGAAPDGRFVVVWDSFGSGGTDTSGQSVQGQRFAADGTPMGSEFQVNTYTTDSQSGSRVAVRDDGSFIVVWISAGSAGLDTSSSSIQGQRFNAAGSSVGGQFEINTYTSNLQVAPAVATAPDGDFIVVWRSFGSDGTDTSSGSIQGQAFNSAGAPLGGEFQVNTYTTGMQTVPAVGVDASGDFVVVWESDGSFGTDMSDLSVQGQRFNAAGAPVGDEFQVNTYTTNRQLNASVGVNAAGEFVVAWMSYGSGGSDNSTSSIQAQRFDAAGAPTGGEFQVNTYTTNSQFAASVSADAAGDFVVTWMSYGSSGSDDSAYSIQGQAYDAAGVPAGGEFQVNTYTTGNQFGPSVARSAPGEFVVAWMSYGSNSTDTTNWSVQGQRYTTGGEVVFSDGFESGDTTGWTSTTQ